MPSISSLPIPTPSGPAPDSPLTAFQVAQQAMRVQLDTPGDTTLDPSFLDRRRCPTINLPRSAYIDTSRGAGPLTTARSTDVLDLDAREASVYFPPRQAALQAAKIVHFISGELSRFAFSYYIRPSPAWNSAEKIM